MTARVLAVLAVAASACISEPEPPCASARPLTELDATDSGGTKRQMMESPWLSYDRNEIFFNATSMNGYGIYQARRNSHTAMFAAPTNIEDPGSNDAFDPTLSSNGLTLWFEIGDGNDGGTIFEATRNVTTDLFAGGVNVFPELTSRYPLLHATFTSDGKQVFFAQRQTQVMGFDIYTANRSSNDPSVPFGPATALPFNTTMDEKGPTISPDGKVLFFHSPMFGDAANQTSATSAIGFATAANEFKDPQPLTKLSHVEGSEDEMGWASEGGNTIVFASARNGFSTLWIACE